MCGIAGHISKNKKEININEIAKAMYSRGPDQQGYFKDEKNGAFINLFSSRLKIIDLNDRSNQPFFSDDLVLIYNGEIYNYLEVKKELINENFVFQTDSDTEVVLCAYKKWGLDFVKKLDGMWTIAIYDRNKNKLILSRDFLGEKPLFLYNRYNEITFGSEINYIFKLNKKKESLNFKKINQFLSCGYKSINKNKETFFQNIYQLGPGEIIEINLNNFSITSKTLSMIEKYPVPCDKKEVENFVKEIFFTEYKKRLRSDVPLAYCLSGGVDSSTLVSIAKKKFNLDPKCFSIIMKDKRYNELENIKILQKKLELNIDFIEIPKLDFTTFLDKISTLIEYKSAPISTISYYAHSYISQKCKEKKYKVIISGTGADEIFTGYYDHYLYYLGNLEDDEILQKELKNFKKYFEPIIRNKLLKYNNFKDKQKFYDHIYDNDEHDNIISNLQKFDFNQNFYSKDLLRNRMLNEMFHESVPVMLYEDDTNSMINSIENRSPYLSKKLINTINSLNSNLLINDGYLKYILRQITQNILPDEIRLNRNKIGFNAALNDLVDINYEDLENFIKENDYLKEMVNIEQLKNTLKNSQLSNANNKLVFNLINLGLLTKKYL